MGMQPMSHFAEGVRGYDWEWELGLYEETLETTDTSGVMLEHSQLTVHRLRVAPPSENIIVTKNSEAVEKELRSIQPLW